MIDNDGIYGDNTYYGQVYGAIRNPGSAFFKEYAISYHDARYYNPDANLDDARRRVNWYKNNSLNSFFEVDTSVGQSGIEAFNDSMLTILQLQSWQTRFGVVQFTPSAATLAMNLDTMRFEIQNDSLEFRDTISILNWPKLDAPPPARPSSQLRLVERDHHIMIESSTDEPILIFDELGRIVATGRTNEVLNSILNTGCYIVLTSFGGQTVKLFVQ